MIIIICIFFTWQTYNCCHWYRWTKCNHWFGGHTKTTISNGPTELWYYCCFCVVNLQHTHSAHNRKTIPINLIIFCWSIIRLDENNLANMKQYLGKNYRFLYCKKLLSTKGASKVQNFHYLTIIRAIELCGFFPAGGYSFVVWLWFTYDNFWTIQCVGGSKIT